MTKYPLQVPKTVTYIQITWIEINVQTVGAGLHCRDLFNIFTQPRVVPCPRSWISSLAKIGVGTVNHEVAVRRPKSR